MRTLRPWLAVATFAMALAVVAPAAAEGGRWAQWGGDAGHSGVAAVGRAPLDVVAIYNLTPAGARVAEGPGPGIVEGPAGPVGVAAAAGSCTLFTVTDAVRGTVQRAPSAFPCPAGATLLAADATHAYVCTRGAGGPLKAIDLQSGRVRWQANASAAQGNPALPIPLPPPTGETLLWGCSGAALDEGRAQIVVPFATPSGRNSVQAHALADGRLLWQTTIPSAAFLPSAPTARPAPVPDPLQELSGTFNATSVTLTETGYVVAGRLVGTAGDSPPAVAWLDTSGTVLGAASQQAGTGVTTASGTRFPLSARPAARGPAAALLMGDQVYIVNPAVGLIPSTPVPSATNGRLDLAPPAWSREALYVPTETGLVIIPSAGSRDVETWGLDFDISDVRVQEVIAAPDAQALVLLSRACPEGRCADLVRVAADGRSLERTPLPFASPRTDPFPGLHLTPVGDRLLAWDREGRAAFLSDEPAIPRPGLTVDSQYPPLNTQLSAEVGHVEGPNTTLHLAWGDGELVADVEPGSTLTHAYRTAGDVELRLTVVLADGRTATTTTTIHVDQDEPNKSFLRVAFSEKYQNYTFFLIGLSLTVLGSVLGVVAATRGRRRLERYLRDLDRIRTRGRGEPLVAIRDLHEYRLGLRNDLARGRLADGQYSLLESQGSELLQILRQRILGAFLGRVSDGFRHALDVALFDGVMEEAERQGLAETARREAGLSEEERRRLKGLIESWRLP